MFSSIVCPSNHSACRMRKRAGRCLAAVRLLVMSIAAHALGGLAGTGSHILAADGARDRDPRLQGFVRTAARLDEELRAILPRHCLQYIFADLPRTSYRMLMWSVVKVAAINGVGLDRFLQYASSPLPFPIFHAHSLSKTLQCTLNRIFHVHFLYTIPCQYQMFCSCGSACGAGK